MRDTLIGGHGESYDDALGTPEFRAETRTEAAGAERARFEEPYDDRFERSHEELARAVAYLGPYIFWATVGAITAGVLVISGLLS